MNKITLKTQEDVRVIVNVKCGIMSDMYGVTAEMLKQERKYK